MTRMPAGPIAAILCSAMLTGCATNAALAPLPAGRSEKVVQHAADVLIDGVRFTRAQGREVAGWCWNDKATKQLASVVPAGVGDDGGVGVTLPTDARGAHSVSCSWHTHPWGPQVVPGPSRQDLRNSTLPWVRGISHFVLDQYGIWQYADGRVIESCPWNRAGTNFDPTRCRTRFKTPAASDVRVTRFYGRRD
jgi:hypothetical protein